MTDEPEESKIVTADKKMNAKTENLHEADEAFLASSITGEGMVPLTPEKLDEMMTNLTKRKAAIDDLFPRIVEATPPVVKLALACWVIKHICDHAREGGSYRYLIYSRLGFGPEAYAPLQWAGALDVSNEFDLSGEKK